MLVIPALSACGQADSEETPREARQALAEHTLPASRPPSAAPEVPATPVVVFLGDSLTAGLGLAEDQAYPAVVERALREEGAAVKVLNAGVSGDTTAGGLSRLPWLLKQRPAVVVVALGANDGLRALPIEQTEVNLREIVRRSREAGARVLLLGMRIPPNYGPYADEFAELYPRLAADLEVSLVPFLLAGVGGNQALNQADGIHPTAEGQEKMAATVVPYLQELLADDAAGSSAAR